MELVDCERCGNPFYQQFVDALTNCCEACVFEEMDAAMDSPEDESGIEATCIDCGCELDYDEGRLTSEGPMCEGCYLDR